MRTDPFRDFDRLAEQIIGTRSRPAAVRLDAYREGENFLVHFDLPGVAVDSIDLTVERNVLTVHATRDRTVSDDVEMLVSERPHGTFSRQLFLGEALDPDRIEADYHDGVLTLRIPVSERAKPRKLTINAAGSGATEIETHRREPVGVGADSA